LNLALSELSSNKHEIFELSVTEAALNILPRLLSEEELLLLNASVASQAFLTSQRSQPRRKCKSALIVTADKPHRIINERTKKQPHGGPVDESTLGFIRETITGT